VKRNKKREKNCILYAATPKEKELIKGLYVKRLHSAMKNACPTKNVVFSVIC